MGCRSESSPGCRSGGGPECCQLCFPFGTTVSVRRRRNLMAFPSTIQSSDRFPLQSVWSGFGVLLGEIRFAAAMHGGTRYGLESARTLYVPPIRPLRSVTYQPAFQQVMCFKTTETTRPTAARTVWWGYASQGSGAFCLSEQSPGVKLTRMFVGRSPGRRATESKPLCLIYTSPVSKARSVKGSSPGRLAVNRFRRWEALPSGQPGPKLRCLPSSNTFVPFLHFSTSRRRTESTAGYAPKETPDWNCWLLGRKQLVNMPPPVPSLKVRVDCHLFGWVVDSQRVSVVASNPRARPGTTSPDSQYPRHQHPRHPTSSHD